MTSYPPTPPPISGDANRACRALIDVLRRQIGDGQIRDFRSTVSDLLKAYVKEGHSKRATRDAIVSLLSQGILQPDSVHGSILETAIVAGEGNDPLPSVSTTTKASFEQIKFRVGERFADWAKHNRSDEFHQKPKGLEPASSSGNRGTSLGRPATLQQVTSCYRVHEAEPE